VDKQKKSIFLVENDTQKSLFLRNVLTFSWPTFLTSKSTHLSS
jgi:hypothetical protein